MADNDKNPREKQPGEKPAGKFHYNPGNMAGKEAETCKGEPEGEGASTSDRTPAAQSQKGKQK